MKIKKFIVGSLQENCYFVYNENSKELIIIDPGCYEDELYDYIKDNSLIPIAIFLTHGHFDHINGVNKFLELFNNLKIYASEKEYELLNDVELNMCHRFEEKEIMIKKYNKLKDGQKLKLIDENITILETPGHTRGSISFLFDDENILFSGDFLFCGTIGRTDLPTSSQEDMQNSIKKISSFNESIIVYPGHGSKTTLKDEINNNIYFKN